MSNKRIAILGASSQIAKDLVRAFAQQNKHELVLFARHPDVVRNWLKSIGLNRNFVASNFEYFTTSGKFDAVLNFVGVGNPSKAVDMGASIFDVTLKYDELALSYLQKHNDCRYIFMSSGAAYGTVFNNPVDQNSLACVAINNLQSQDWYGVAKLHAECRHRSLASLAIVDIRIFNYFSNTQDLRAGFLMTDILSAIQEKTVMKTSADFIVRDFIHPSDFYNLVKLILSAPATNAVVDAYSKEPIDKLNLLAAMQQNFRLQYEIVQASVGSNATGGKQHYYTLNTLAKSFGYEPQLTSIEGLLLECNTALRFSKT